ITYVSIRQPPPSAARSPYTTLFRSSHRREFAALGANGDSTLGGGAGQCFAQGRIGRDEGTAGQMQAHDFHQHLIGVGCAVEGTRSEEHTSELQSRENLVCRLLLEKT